MSDCEIGYCENPDGCNPFQVGGCPIIRQIDEKLDSGEPWYELRLVDTTNICPECGHKMEYRTTSTGWVCPICLHYVPYKDGTP